ENKQQQYAAEGVSIFKQTLQEYIPINIRHNFLSVRIQNAPMGIPRFTHELKNKNTMNSMEKLETMNTEDDNIVMQNKITSDTEMSTSNNEQESQSEHQTESTEDKPNMEHENISVYSLASLYNNVWANNTDPIDKENEQGFTVVSRKKHINKSRITTPKVGRTTVLKTSALYTKARGLQ
ncbi:1919_t:CDS:2, partial [Cetraspora pellucida]